jgi:L-threonylcarbamoyladenylate synthase
VIDAAVRVLRRGGLVAFPTETVYGLGADATNVAAVERIFAVKGRPHGHPLIVHLGAGTSLDEWALDVPEAARALAAAFWPGPLTLLLHRHPRVPDVITGGRPTVGLRVPGHPVALDLLGTFGGGVAAPSANRFGRVSPTTAEHVRADLGDAVDLILDGGPTTVGVESTIVDCTTDDGSSGSAAAPAAPVSILRHGAVTADAVREVVGGPVVETDTRASRAPGMLASHYAPHATVVLAPDRSAADERAADERRAGRAVEVLAPDVSVEDYARNLYGWLREADARVLDVLVVVPPPDTGLGVAVNERLRKAAGPRE